MAWKVLPTFSFMYLMVSGLILRSSIHFDFWLSCMAVEESKFISPSFFPSFLFSFSSPSSPSFLSFSFVTSLVFFLSAVAVLGVERRAHICETRALSTPEPPPQTRTLCKFASLQPCNSSTSQYMCARI